MRDLVFDFETSVEESIGNFRRSSQGFVERFSGIYSRGSPRFLGKVQICEIF